jgi:polyhydroxyalkanoate synthesis repressor PhaR
MIRVIKRYESRKLYDTEESRYVSLDDVATWVREGQQVRIVDNASSEDVTAQTLTQIILEEGRKGISFLPSELMHELVRLGERAVSTGVEQIQHGVDRLVRGSLDRFAPLRRVREDMTLLRQRLEELEGSLTSLEAERQTSPREVAPLKPKAAAKPATKATAKSVEATKAAASKAPAPAAKPAASRRPRTVVKKVAPKAE